MYVCCLIVVSCKNRNLIRNSKKVCKMNLILKFFFKLNNSTFIFAIHVGSIIVMQCKNHIFTLYSKKICKIILIFQVFGKFCKIARHYTRMIKNVDFRDWFVVVTQLSLYEWNWNFYQNQRIVWTWTPC